MMLESVDIREGLEGLTPARIATLYRRAPLLRPVNDPEKLWQMFTQSSIVLTAWSGQRLVGIARILSDGVMTSYICDLAVEPDVQRSGVGRQLIQAIFERCAGTDLIVRDASISSRYYARLGFHRAEEAWVKPA